MRTPSASIVLAVTLVSGFAVGCARSHSTATTPAATASLSAPASPKYKDEPSVATATRSCGSLIAPNAAAAAALPAGFPTVGAFVATYTVKQGATLLVRGVVTGAPADIVATRDAGFVQIKARGYQVTGSDQEPGFEADGDFTTPSGGSGNINVKTLCLNFLVVTYTVG